MKLGNPVLPADVAVLSLFLAPGYIVGTLAGNGIEPPTWVAVLGNFVFYLGLSYLALTAWEKHTHNAGDRKVQNRVQVPRRADLPSTPTPTPKR